MDLACRRSRQIDTGSRTWKAPAVPCENHILRSSNVAYARLSKSAVQYSDKSCLHQIANAVHGCQRTFLDEQIWEDVPWEDDLLSKTAYDYLVDVLCHIPYFLEIVAHRSESYTGVIPEQDDYKILEKQLIELLESLKDLHDAWGAQWPNAYWPVSPQPISPSEVKDTKFPQSPYETLLHFMDMWRADDFCIFNMALILALLLLQDVAEPQVVQNTTAAHVSSIALLFNSVLGKPNRPHRGVPPARPTRLARIHMLYVPRYNRLSRSGQRFSASQVHIRGLRT